MSQFMVAREMIKSLPLYERKSKVYIELFDVAAKEFELLDGQLADVRKQFFIDTATWGLKVYEKEFKLIVPTGSTLENRRAAIKAKWRSDGKADRALLESVASAILRTVVKVEFDGRILFYFEVSDDEVSNFDLFYKSIDEIKPAHLPMNLELRVSSSYIITTKEYTFPVPYPITGTFTTTSIHGVASKATPTIGAKEYTFQVPYPITGTFYCTEEGRG